MADFKDASRIGQEAWTKAEYDAYMRNHTRTPGDATVHKANRGQVRPDQTYTDYSVRPTSAQAALRDRKANDRKKNKK